MSSSHSSPKESILAAEDGSISPPTALSPSSTYSSCVKNAKMLLWQTSPDPGLCAITLVDRGVGVYYFVDEDIGSENIRQLEFAWGFEHGTLDINNVRNMMFLTTQMKDEFKQGNLALLPSPETVRDIIRQTGVDGVSEVRTLYSKFDSQGMYEYVLVHLEGETGDIARLDLETGERTIFHAPYKNFPVIRSHVHPCFVILSTRLKGIAYSYPFKDESHRRAAVCRGISNRWLTAKPWVMPEVISSPSSESYTDTSSISRSDLPSTNVVAPKTNEDAKLRRKYSGASEGMPDSKRQHGITADSLNVLGETWWGIQEWMRDVASCGSPDASSTPEDSAARLALEEYRNGDSPPHGDPHE